MTSPGTAFECLSIGIEVAKEQVVDSNGQSAYRVGFRIGGGIDQDATRSPYSDKGIYITHVEANSPASSAGLKPHDKILQINGLDCTMMTHERAVKSIQRCSVLQLLIARREVAI
ncbi:Tax1-binding protein 3-like protein [Aphelenchoides besseyi]|nr:Tax1-binding protein 3-like protein [Aphelenchoides besseyi]KAI6201282.1 Tax1-binding protein 3-like protein [Aphelenchoides besseyi]